MTPCWSTTMCVDSGVLCSSHPLPTWLGQELWARNRFSRGFTGSSFSEALAVSRTPIRTWLMDQKRIAGIGNIYANEALSRAGIHPQKPSAEVRRDEALRLHRAVRSVLRAAVIAKGTTLRDYRTAAGSKGSYAPELRVYGRAGSPCTQCGHPIERLIFGGRSAFFCRNCQPPTGVRA